MPRTNTEAIRELERVVAGHDTALEQFATHAELVREMNQSVGVILERGDHTRTDLDRLEKRIDELDRKLWTITCLFIAALLTLAATLIMQIVKK